MPNRILRENLLKSRKYDSISVAERDLYIRLLLLADDWGRFYADPVIIAKEAYPICEGITSKQTKPMIESLTSAGMIVCYTDGKEQYLEITNWSQRTRSASSRFPSAGECQTNDGHMTAKGQSPAHVDEDVFEDEDEDGDGKLAKPHSSKDVLEAYHRLCPSLPKVRELSSARRDKLRTRLSEHPLLEWWEDVFRMAESVPFCKGNNDRKWKATFDWFIENDGNAIKVLEGKYGVPEQQAMPKTTREDMFKLLDIANGLG